jgi:ribosomal protein S18 acetylase RimI-like enzyme
MARLEIVDLIDEADFGLVPPCSDPSFDHRTCDYWEDADRGSKARRSSWLPVAATGSASGIAATTGTDSRPTDGGLANPFAPPPRTQSNPFMPASRPAPNPFAPAFSEPTRNPFLDDLGKELAENPFAPQRPARPTIAVEAPRKLQLLGRGLGIFGSYAKLLLLDGQAVGYCQFGPLSAYPRALRLRELYPQLPDAPLPAVITCIATTAGARRSGFALKLVGGVIDDLADRGFAAVEAYPEARAREDATPAARPEFWIRAGFRLAVDDERFPVVRREL